MWKAVVRPTNRLPASCVCTSSEHSRSFICTWIKHRQDIFFSPLVSFRSITQETAAAAHDHQVWQEINPSRKFVQLEANTNRLVIKVVLVCVCLCLNHFSGKPWCVFRLCPNIFNEGWGCEALCVKPAPVNVYNRILVFLCLSGLFLEDFCTHWSDPDVERCPACACWPSDDLWPQLIDAL